MSVQKTVTNVEIKRSNWPLFLSIIIFLAVAAFGVYLTLQKGVYIDEQARLDKDIADLNTQITALQSENLQGAALAQQWLAEIEKNEIIWSKVIDNIKSLVPLDEKTNKPLVSVLSYNGMDGGKITLNVTSAGAEKNTFSNVAKLISSFNNSQYFVNGVVPSVSRGENESGETILSFVFNVDYKEKPVQKVGTVKKVTGNESNISVSTQEAETDNSGTQAVSRKISR